MEIFKDFDIVADGTDNFPTRYLVNDACVLSGKPNVYGSIFRFEGQASVFATEQGPCYRCLYPEPPPPGLVPSCAEGGVLGILPGLVGVIQATEVIKLILGQGEPLIGRLLLVDSLDMRFRELKLRKNPDCPVCGTHPTVTKLIDYEQFCGIQPAARPMRRRSTASSRSTVTAFKQQRDAGKDYFLLDVREPHEFKIAEIGGYLIPLGDLQKRVGELDTQPRDRGALQDGRPQPESGGVPAAGRVQGKEPGRRHPGLERADRSQSTQVLREFTRNRMIPKPLERLRDFFLPEDLRRRYTPGVCILPFFLPCHWYTPGIGLEPHGSSCYPNSVRPRSYRRLFLSPPLRAAALGRGGSGRRRRRRGHRL